MSRKAWCLYPETTGSGGPYILDSFPVVVGRDGQCDIRLEDPSIGKLHAQITRDGRRLVIHDLGTAHGTRVDGKPIRSAKISPTSRGVRVHFGAQAFTLRFAVVGDNAPVLQPAPEEEDQDTRQWFFSRDGQDYGPLSAQEMFEAVDRGLLRPGDEVWNSEIDYRVLACEVKGLFETTPEATLPTAAEGQAVVMPGAAAEGLRICPHCWSRFKLEDILFIASHPELLGDPVLGPDEPQRFLPSRFTPEGIALDTGGFLCPDMACPRCHLRLPATFLQQTPLFLSVIGAPASGKSYFLASMNWRLRNTLPHFFALRYTDVDAVTNQWLNEYEEKLFLQADDNAWQSIDKTQMLVQNSLYRQVSLSGANVFLPLPCMFALQSEEGAAYFVSRGLTVNRTVVLYDNAGEHFQPGADSALNPGTRHLVYAEGLFFLFDPTRDPRFRRIATSEDVQLKQKTVQRQDVLLVESIGRIRRLLGLNVGVRFQKPIVVGVSKADVLRGIIDLPSEPWVWDPVNRWYALDLATLAEISFQVRFLLCEYAPEVVTAVESFADRVVYLPNSALGHSPSVIGNTLAVRPRDVRPQWVEVPMLYVLAKLGFVPEARQPKEVAPLPERYEVKGRTIRLLVPGTEQTLEVPTLYAGFVLRCPRTRQLFRVPDVPAAVRL